MSRVFWAERALDDLRAIGDHIASDGPLAARQWVARLQQQAEVAAEAPAMGRRVPEVGHNDIREAYLRSYRIVYRAVPKGIVVLTVFEGHRTFPPLDGEESG